MTPTDVVRIVEEHQAAGDHPDTFLDCCEALTLAVVRQALHGDAARLRDLTDTALAPWRDA